MIKHIILILFVFALVSVGCETGPTGANPVSQPEVIGKDGLRLHRSADVMMSSDSVKIVTIPFPFDTILVGDLRFHVGPFTTFTNPDVVLRFKDGVPTAPGTFAWEEPIVRAAGPSFQASLVAGLMIDVEGTDCYGVSGNTVVTEVQKDASGKVTFVRGYFNGIVRGIWPESGVIPPGTTELKLFGQDVTIHSGWFESSNRSNSTK